MGGKRSYVISQDPVELIIPGYPKGSNLTILNTAYCGRKVLEQEDNETGEMKKVVTKDFISILFRDNDKGVKKVHVIYEPLYTFYLLDEDYEVPTHNLFFIEKDKVVPITCKYADILRCIAEVTNNQDFYRENVDSGNAGENRKLHMHPSVFMSDMNVENYYRFLFGLSYQNEPFKLKKGFLDIETDGRYAAGDFPEPGEVPINAIAYCDEANNITYQFLLDDPRNPEIEKYKQYIATHDIESELREFVIQSVGGYKKAVKFGVDKMNYKLIFFKDECELIKTTFQVINRTVPDFMMIWNMAFDLNYIIARCVELGMEPMDVICDNRVEQQFLRFYIDERNKNNYEERGDFVSVSTFTVWIDQMISFASRRKGRGRYASFKLDAIGEDVAGVNKLDYSHITRHIDMLPYKDFKTFSFYNVMDVIVQKCIEVCTQDCEYVFTKCLVNNTIYSKCHRQSVYLANRFAKDFYNAGYIIGNNKNLWNEKPNVKFCGAAVGDPLHNSQDTMMKINGKPSMITNNAVDFDYSSLYPSIILENNLAPNTQIGRLIIEDPDDPEKCFGLYEHHDMYTNDDQEAKYSRGGEFLENLMCSNILEFGRRWLGLGDLYQVLFDLDEYYKYNGYIGRPINYNIRDAFYFTKNNYVEAFKIVEDYMPSQPFIFDNRVNKDELEELRKEIEKGATL